MIEAWTWPTPNGHKVHIALEELALPYTVVPVNIGAGEQFKPEFLAITPNHRIPAIVDRDGPGGKPLALFESGAILIYLAEKTGRLIPHGAGGALRLPAVADVPDGRRRVRCSGRRTIFVTMRRSSSPIAIERYANEATRLYGVLDKRLAEARVSGRRRVFDRRHRDLPVAAVSGAARHRLQRLSGGEALVPDHRGAAGGATGGGSPGGAAAAG